MQIPFPTENQPESTPKKAFSVLRLNKIMKIQALTSRGQSNLQTLPGALFQTMGVTDKERRKAKT